MVMDILFLINIAVIIGFLFIWSVMVFKKNNYSLFEIGWPLSLVLATAVSFLLYGSASIYRRLLVLTVTIWGLRLAFYLYTHYWGRPEGARFVRMREKTGSKVTGIKAFFTLFIIPAIVFSLVSLPITIGFLESQTTMAWWQYTGLGLWALGLLIEMGTEYQLKRFKNKTDNDGQLITKGFWRLSRHPHYFGTAIVWWGIYLLTIVSWVNLEAVLIGILSPIVMTLFLVYLASRSTVEAAYKEREELQNYTRKTPQFFPFVSKIGAVLLGIGRFIGKGISKLMSSNKNKSTSSDVTEPVESDLTGSAVVDEPVNETTSETTWFKPEIEEDALAAHGENTSDLSGEVHSDLTDSGTEIEQAQDESTIDEMLADHEFTTAETEEQLEEADQVHAAHLDFQTEAPTDFPEVPTFEDLPGGTVELEDASADLTDLELASDLEGDFKENDLNEAGDVEGEVEQSTPIDSPEVPNFDDLPEELEATDEEKINNNPA